MSMRTLPNAAAMSQFFGGFTGACTWTARRACLHTLDPNRWPLESAALVADVQRAVAAQIAAPSGACRLVDIATSLDQWDHIPYQLHPYREPWPMDTADGWHPLLSAVAGYGPILLQIANGAALGYEAGLQYHAVAILGHDSAAQTYAVADSANPACFAGGLVTYALGQLIDARPCGALLPSLPPPPPPPPAPPPHPTLDTAKLHANLSQAQALIQAALGILTAAGD